jgi:hypothetical protein
MKIRYFAQLALAFALNALDAAPLPSIPDRAPAPLAVYYAFDNPPPAGVFTELQRELGRILAPAGLRTAWRVVDTRQGSAEDFPSIVVFRFNGKCSLENEPAGPGDAPLPLAQTRIADGRVLPFGNVNCEAVREFIAPAVKLAGFAVRNEVLGRALARVTAHEIYHMLTGSETHAREGIARAALSRADLTNTTFFFARMQTDWIKSWVEKQRPVNQAARPGNPQIAGMASSRNAEQPALFVASH